MPAFIRTSGGLTQAERALAAATIGDLRETVVNLTDLQPLYSTVIFTGAANTIPANVTRTAFADKLGEADGAGIAVTLADATFFDGETPTGQLIILEGLGFGIQFATPAATAEDLAQVQRNISVVMNLRGTSVRLGSLEDWPGIEGVSTLDGNGRTVTDVRRFPGDNQVVLEPLDDFSIFLRTERAITTSFIANNVLISAYLPATRVLDQRVLGLS